MQNISPEELQILLQMTKLTATVTAAPFMLILGIPYLISLGFTVFLGVKTLFTEIRWLLSRR